MSLKGEMGAVLSDIGFGTWGLGPDEACTA